MMHDLESNKCQMAMRQPHCHYNSMTEVGNSIRFHPSDCGELCRIQQQAQIQKQQGPQQTNAVQHPTRLYGKEIGNRGLYWSRTCGRTMHNKEDNSHLDCHCGDSGVAQKPSAPVPGVDLHEVVDTPSLGPDNTALVSRNFVISQ